jgi:hypothetical protein
MTKSGLIFGGVMILGSILATLFSPFCVPCVGLLLGFAAGYVAGLFGKSTDQPQAVKSGALAGLMAGAGAVIGEMIGGVINGVLVGPQGASQILHSLGLQTGVQMTPQTYWISQVGLNCVVSLVSVALMAAAGALGGLICWQVSGKKASGLPGGENLL